MKIIKKQQKSSDIDFQLNGCELYCQNLIKNFYYNAYLNQDIKKNRKILECLYYIIVQK